MRLFRIALLAFSIGAAAPLSTVAQRCAPLKPDGDQLGYSKRSNDARCEGFYQQLSAGTAGVNVVSLTYGKVAFDPARDRELRLRLVEPPIEPIGIRGSLIPTDRYYRLDAQLSPGEPVVRLPLADVIKPSGMTPEQLGVYAFRSLPGNQEELIPLVVGADAEPSVRPDAPLWIVLRPAIDIANLRYRVRAAGQVPDYQFVPLGRGPIPANSPLAFALGAAPSGRAILDLRFVTTSGEERNDTIRFAVR
jgi:hypothetical protein